MPVFAVLKEILQLILSYKSAKIFKIVIFKCSKLVNLGN